MTEALLPLAAMLAIQTGGDPLSVGGAPATSGYFARADVVRVSPRPPFGSGTIMVTTDFDVRVPGGETYRMNMIYSGEDQFIPPAGSICQISFRPGGIRASSGVDLSNMVDTVICDTGSSVTDVATGSIRESAKQPRLPR